VAVAEFPLQAEAVVAVAAFPVHELDDPLAFPVKSPVTFPKTPPLAVIKPLALIVVKLAEDAVVAPIVALLIVPPEITGLVRVLFVSVSVVALPTRVSVDVGSVIVPVFDMELIIGVVRVLLVSVWVSIVVTRVFVAGIVVPLIVDVEVIAPVTARVPPMVALDVTANPVPDAFVAEIVSAAPRVPATRVSPLAEVTLNLSVFTDTLPATPRVPVIVAFPPTEKLDDVPPFIRLEGVTFFKETAEES
jgi:hypothetical protein